MTKSVGLIGKGIVGGAVCQSFEKRGLEVVTYDKYKQIGALTELLNLDIIFVCLPTPYVEGVGYDKSALYEVCSFFKENYYYGGVLVIKSTVEPGTCSELVKQYGLNIVHNPEFLSARTAEQDFENQNHLVIGADSSELSSLISDFYTEFYPQTKQSLCTLQESELMKLFSNNFYAMKVQIFNEFYDLCQHLDVNYEVVRTLILERGWTNPMHTEVPGPDGKLSYSGMCFPKDTNALLHFMKQKGSLHSVLEAVISERNRMRD